MTTRKRNEWLDIGGSDEEEGDQYESANEESRGDIGRSIKRRRVDQAVNEDSEDDDLETGPKTKVDGAADVEDDDDEDDIDDTFYSTATHLLSSPQSKPDKSKPLSKDKPVKPLTQAQLARAQKAVRKTGVIYISRIPPFMKPSTLKTLLSPHGDIGRIFLTPEPSEVYTRRIRSGGNKKRSFTDGWVEFLSKRDAKIVAETLNGNIVGGKKGNYYHDDVWNIKYLRGFKWRDLTEQIANEEAERAARLRTEIAKTRRENRDFVASIEKGKQISGMQAKRAAKGTEGGDGEPKREFRQNKARTRDTDKGDEHEGTKRVLSKVF